MVPTNDIPVFDADNHLYETKDALTKFLPARYKGAVDYVDVHGRTKIVVRGQISDYIPNPTFDVVARPGAQEDYYRHGNPEGKSYREIFGAPVRCIDAWREPAARLKLMDEQGLDRTLMFPTLASLIEERMRDDPDLVHAVIHSLNEWLYETWQFNYEGLDRIFTTPVISLPIVEKAIEELEWVLERGARVILIRPAPVPGLRGARSFGLPEFDPFWERVQEADILVTLHSSDSGYDRYYSDWTGTSSEMLPFKPSAFRMLQAWRPVEDAVAALVCHGALSRFPRLKIAVVENGSSWVAPLLLSIRDLYKKLPQDFAEDPIEVIKRNINISPFWEEDLGALAELIGEDRVLFGSDYPHPEGLASPLTYLDELKHLPEATTRKIMGGNLARLMNISVPA
ncbi:MULTISPECIES: amidohydrolase family protein [unclassified Parafrankia]|uniref:amidohydrolase family protein n=1 Tax=unclassified Parafrankia TaxID=2994368 RepID=UPI000DD422DC|nr:MULTISPECIES: amidohydrolase family protein [unclassified Parafrankia]TCJ35748.1 amidohydrolase [Parafrankia sp. BMG5.11]